jgi:hypothetical protein
MSRIAWLLLLILPFAALPASAPLRAGRSETVAPLQTWNPDSLAWSTVLIWTERSSGMTLTSGFLIDKARRRVIAARHALEDLKPDGADAGMIEKFYVVWPSPAPDGGVIKESDYYFQQMRARKTPYARLIAQDASRDLVLLEAGSEPPAQSQALSLQMSAVEPSTTVMGIAQPFTRSGLWHPFTGSVTNSVTRRLTYTKMGQPVALYLAQSEQNVEFGYSGAPIVLPHSGKLVGMLLAAQINQPLSFALISSQEIHRFLSIE